MASLIPQDFIEDLIARVPIVDVVGSRVQVKKSGSTLKACCPFHQEKTPSFHVNVQKNYYHCFGCGANGNSINFLRDHDNLSFNEAVEELAKIAGVEIPRDEKIKKAYNVQNKLWDALEYASLRYRDALKSHADKGLAEAYLRKRGLSAEIIERFSIGFAPAQRDFLSSKAVPATLASLIQTKTVLDKYERPFDLFQNRLMFPIRNSRGKTIAFGGRTLGDDKAKYINSPESEVFHKSNELYGLFEANQASRQVDKLLVVEGYMDVVSLAQFGITYAVATLGTATNTENLSQLLRRCQTIVFCFDGDNAGVQAAKKAMENALPLFEDGMQLSFLLLPRGEDPDTLIRDEGKEAFERRIENAQPLSEFLFRIYSEGLDLNIAEHKGVLKQRAESQIEQVKSFVLKNALRQKLNTLTYRRQKKESFNDANVNRDMVTAKVIPDPDTSLCLALYYDPSRSGEFLSALGGSSSFHNTIEFADFLRASQLQTTEALLLYLATDDAGHRVRFRDLFKRLEWVPNADELREVSDDLLARIVKDNRRSDALKAAKTNKLPSQMTAEEKRALRSISVTKP
jgi:DNA primase